MKMIQQGDVCLEACASIPSQAKEMKMDNGQWVLAYGEHTGHKHALDAEGVECFECDGKIYVRVSKEAQLKHEEHNQITIPVGVYEVTGVQEFDHFTEEARRVAD